MQSQFSWTRQYVRADVLLREPVSHLAVCTIQVEPVCRRTTGDTQPITSVISMDNECWCMLNETFSKIWKRELWTGPRCAATTLDPCDDVENRGIRILHEYEGRECGVPAVQRRGRFYFRQRISRLRSSVCFPGVIPRGATWTWRETVRVLSALQEGRRGAYRRTDRRGVGASDFGGDRRARESDECNSGRSNYRGATTTQIMEDRALQRTVEQTTDVPVSPVGIVFGDDVQILYLKAHFGDYRRTDRHRPSLSDWVKIVELVRSTSATADPRVIVDVLVPREMEERVLQRTMEQITDVTVSQVVAKIEQFVQIIPQERISKRSQNVDVPVPQISEKIVNAVFFDECNSGPSNKCSCVYSTDFGGAGSAAHRGADYRRLRATGHESICAGCPNHSPKKRISNRVSQLADEPVPQNLEVIAKLVRWTAAMADRRAIVDVPIPQIVKTNVEIVEKVFQEWISEKIRKEIVSVLVLRCRNKVCE